MLLRSHQARASRWISGVSLSSRSEHGLLRNRIEPAGLGQIESHRQSLTNRGPIAGSPSRDERLALGCQMEIRLRTERLDQLHPRFDGQAGLRVTPLRRPRQVFRAKPEDDGLARARSEPGRLLRWNFHPEAGTARAFR